VIRTAWLVLKKDLTVEVRSLEIAYTTLFFAVSCVLFFAYPAHQILNNRRVIGASELFNSL